MVRLCSSDCPEVLSEKIPVRNSRLVFWVWVDRDEDVKGVGKRQSQDRQLCSGACCLRRFPLPHSSVARRVLHILGFLGDSAPVQKSLGRIVGQRPILLVPEFQEEKRSPCGSGQLTYGDRKDHEGSSSWRLLGTKTGSVLTIYTQWNEIQPNQRIESIFWGTVLTPMFIWPAPCYPSLLTSSKTPSSNNIFEEKNSLCFLSASYLCLLWHLEQLVIVPFLLLGLCPLWDCELHADWVCLVHHWSLQGLCVWFIVLCEQMFLD